MKIYLIGYEELDENGVVQPRIEAYSSYALRVRRRTELKRKNKAENQTELRIEMYPATDIPIKGYGLIGLANIVSNVHKHGLGYMDKAAAEALLLGEDMKWAEISRL